MASKDSTEPNVDEESSVLVTSARILTAASAGIAFGIAIEKGRVFEPNLIVGQMKFQHFVMFKMFLSAISSSCFSLAALSYLAPTSVSNAKFAFKLTMHRGLLAVGLGGAMLGAGMTMSGACPGTVLVQLGAGVSSALYVLVGGFAGVFLYAVSEPMLRRAVLPVGDIGPTKFVEEKTHTSYPVVIVALGVAVAALVAVLESLVPWRVDVGAPASADIITNMAGRYWSPYVSGAIIGLLQLPVTLLLGDTLGTSSSYTTELANACYACAPRMAVRSNYLMSVKDGLSNWWQVIYTGGAILGGFLSASASRSMGVAAPLAPSRAFFGGLIMLFGSRLAGGCTSGHGISGTALGNVLSFFAVVAMLAGGMATALVV